MHIAKPLAAALACAAIAGCSGGSDSPGQDNGFLTLKFTNGVWPFR